VLPDIQQKVTQTAGALKYPARRYANQQVPFPHSPGGILLGDKRVLCLRLLHHGTNPQVNYVSKTVNSLENIVSHCFAMGRTRIESPAHPE
jgi:hypothetical protein